MSTAETPVVSILTPTWQRHETLFERCIPSVLAQAWPDIEHVIVSDGPDDALPGLLFEYASTMGMTACGGGLIISRDDAGDVAGYGLRPAPGRTVTFRYAQLPGHEPALHWGSPARKHGASIATGELIAYCDDDDALRPQHVELLARAILDNPGTGWACSRMTSHLASGEAVIGHGQLGFGNVGTPMLMHRAALLETANWDVSAPGEDWEIVSRWLGAGARYVRVDAETVDVWPSAYHNGKL
ncbi:MAG: glycosyltransferase family 2 protein [Actinomycetota bacterium]|nr:glycosyltransferase family 2 protein [Actinomycetota bacterium]